MSTCGLLVPCSDTRWSEKTYVAALSTTGAHADVRREVFALECKAADSALDVKSATYTQSPAEREASAVGKREGGANVVSLVPLTKSMTSSAKQNRCSSTHRVQSVCTQRADVVV